ncbi:MAG: quinolinate synthase NadA [Candidatus Omnitrophica bacterium]|nr:quinolinate synthase NadA [Candidatus Omnitrophota bacterium]
MVYTEEDDLKYQQALKDKIAHLRKEKNAVILAHNYQRPEVQDVADIRGDSLALAQAAIRTDAKIIVLCGVHFMAEIASILNPAKKVLLPVEVAGCPASDMITVKELRVKKDEHPDASVVCYVNSSAAVKAESDVCCTSANAIEVVKSLSNRKIIFVPDKNLGLYVKSHVKEKEIITWRGVCPTHVRVSLEEVLEAKEKYPDAEFIAHPECEMKVLKKANFIGGTGGMLKYVKSSPAKRFIIGTERGLIHRLKMENPEKEFFSPSRHFICADMKLTTLGWVTHALELEVHEVKVPEGVRLKAKKSLDRMLEITENNFAQKR